MRLFALLPAGLTLAIAAHAAWGFDFKTVTSQARALAQQPYKAPPPIPDFLRDLTYTQYQNIRFKPEKSLWRGSHAPFQVMLVPIGLYYSDPVQINLIDSNRVVPLLFQKDDFSFELGDGGALQNKIPPSLGYAGFKLTFPLKDPNVQDQFIVFAGASYFRGVGATNVFGLSARGIAVDTGLPAGEEFPRFSQFWLVRPEASAKTMTVYALLDGKSLTGAYRFIIRPGAVTTIDVKANLFMRKAVDLLGVAPLTSMFFYGENTPHPPAEWRPQVHDSDGLLIHNGVSGEWLWRPLINPRNLQMDYFHVDELRGFGLLQRQDSFQEYQDLAARYEQRPSAWVDVEGNWGPGNIVLVQLPTPNETNDNIVAFWSPAEKVTDDAALSFAYTLRLGKADVANESMGKAETIFIGSGHKIGGGTVKGAYRIIVDFDGGPLATLPLKTAPTGVVTALEGGQILESFVEYVPPLRGWRLSILAKPAEDKPLAMRAFLKEGDKAMTETWTYRLPPEDLSDIEGN